MLCKLLRKEACYAKGCPPQKKTCLLRVWFPKKKNRPAARKAVLLNCKRDPVMWYPPEYPCSNGRRGWVKYWPGHLGLRRCLCMYVCVCRCVCVCVFIYIYICLRGHQAVAEPETSHLARYIRSQDTNVPRSTTSHFFYFFYHFFLFSYYLLGPQAVAWAQASWVARYQPPIDPPLLCTHCKPRTLKRQRLVFSL